MQARKSHTTTMTLILLLWGIAVSLTQAGSLTTPKRYTVIDVQVREITLNGMAQRVQLLSGTHTVQQENRQTENNRLRVSQVYKRNGMNTAAHAAYGTRHAKAIANWLQTHPDWQRRYAELDRQFEMLSQQLDALTGN